MSKKIEKQKMATIAEVHSRIIWDANLDRNVFVAGFYERVSNEIREKPLAQWGDNSDIPLHRIRYIRCGDTIIWDRDDRIDLISTNQLPDIAWKPIDPEEAKRSNLTALIANNRAKIKPRDVYKFNGNEWRIAVDRAKSIDLERSLKIVTYNILFDIYEADKIYSNERWQLVLAELERNNADIIALQEVTIGALEIILATDWIKDYFISESPAGNNIKPYGNLLLSRWQFDLVEHRFSAHKRAVIGEWNIGNNKSFHLANVHLTSDWGKDCLQKRDRQLATVINYLQEKAGDCFIVGDFNARNEQLKDLVNYANFSDLWLQMHPDREGHTFNPDRNSLAKLMSLEGNPARLDRILWRQGKDSLFQPRSIDLLGDKPTVNSQNIELYPSDHFGLCGILNVARDNHTQLSSNISTGKENLSDIEPVYQSIVAIIPPDNLLPQIQAIRKIFDRRSVKILPHITLLYGFLPDRYFHRVVESIEPILAKMKPFTVTLTEFDIFIHHKTATAWLHPVANPDDALSQLQDTLFRLFPQCYEQSTKTAAGFTPHLTIGQFNNEAEAREALPPWHPLKFTVDAVALLSRRREESFVIRHQIGIGKQLPKIANCYALEELIYSIEPELTAVDRSRRETILDLVKQACSEALGFEARLHLLGSAKLEVESVNSDLDVVCLIPDYLIGEDFLNRVAASLEGFCDRLQVVSNAKFPLLSLEIEGISLDLLYDRVDSQIEYNNLDFTIRSPHIKEPKSIVGCWEADIILDTVRQNIPLSCFRIFLRSIRAWAKIRGIYGNSWGFLGGFSWSLLCANACVGYRGNISLEALLEHFFRVMSRYDLQQVIALTDAGKSYQIKLPRDIFPIVSSIEPCKNTARNITPSTTKILREEFNRGAAITKDIIFGKESRSSLYDPVDFSQSASNLITITVVRSNLELCHQISNILEANIIGLIIELDRLASLVRPQPQIEKNENYWDLKLYLNLPEEIELDEIERIVKDWLDRTIMNSNLEERRSISQCISYRLSPV